MLCPLGDTECGIGPTPRELSAARYARWIVWQACQVAILWQSVDDLPFTSTHSLQPWQD
jgi:hypothetical protein